MAITHKGFEKIEHFAPVRHGDTIYGESEVFAKEPIPDRPERGLVESRDQGAGNQHGTLIMAFPPQAGRADQALRPVPVPGRDELGYAIAQRKQTSASRLDRFVPGPPTGHEAGLASWLPKQQDR